MPSKCAIDCFLYKHRNVGAEDKYALILGMINIKLNANKSKGLSSGFIN